MEPSIRCSQITGPRQGYPNLLASGASRASRRSFFLNCVAFFFCPPTNRAQPGPSDHHFPPNFSLSLSDPFSFLFPSHAYCEWFRTPSRHTSSFFSFCTSPEVRSPSQHPHSFVVCLSDADESTTTLLASCIPVACVCFLLASCHASWDLRGSPLSRSCLIAGWFRRDGLKRTRILNAA